MTGYNIAETMAMLLKQCGDDLSRENVMKQAASLKDVQLVRPVARHQDQHPRHRLRPDRAIAADAVQGENWKLFGDVSTAKSRARGG